MIFFSQIIKNSIEISDLIFEVQIFNGLKKISIMVLVSGRVCSEGVMDIDVVVE